MKKLNLNQMETFEAGGQGRKCFLMGALTFMSAALGPTAFLAAAMYTVAECAAQ